jgi:hypothetical protein
VAELLAGGPGADRSAAADLATIPAPVAAVDDPAADDDLQLALYLCFELHYRSFPGVEPGWEWHPGLLTVRAALERAFLDAVADRRPRLRLAANPVRRLRRRSSR